MGDERVAPNGYRYRKTSHGWVLVHRLIAEKRLGRKLHPNEYASFEDGDRTNFDPENIIVRLRGRTSLRKRLALVEDKIRELIAERDDINRRLQVQASLGED